MTTVLLGPQRCRQTAGPIADSLAPDGPVATVTAGWRDRESDDAELDAVLGGRTRNLELFTRLGHVIRHDRTFAAAATSYYRSVDEANSLYNSRLQHATDALYATMRRSVRADLKDSALRAGLQAVRDIDSWYLWLIDELMEELRTEGDVDGSEIIGKHRGEVAEILGGSVLLAIAGGHVSFLGRCLRLFDVAPPEHLPVLGWSAGAMVLTENVVLYHDNGPEGIRPAEVWDRGLGRVKGIVAMPHARRRLQLDDPVRNQALAHRFAPARTLLLDDGVAVSIGPDGRLPDDARVIGGDGSLTTIAAETEAGNGGAA